MDFSEGHEFDDDFSDVKPTDQPAQEPDTNESVEYSDEENDFFSSSNSGYSDYSNSYYSDESSYANSVTDDVQDDGWDRFLEEHHLKPIHHEPKKLKEKQTMPKKH